MYQKFSSEGHVMHHPNPHEKSLARLTVDLHKYQLLPGPELESLSNRFLYSLNDSLRWENMDQAYILEDGANHRTMSLLSWCLETLLKAGTTAFFGERLLEMDPGLPQSFYEFDKNSWMALYKLPKAFSKKMSSPLAKNIQSVTAYFQLPKAERSGANWFNETLETEQRQLGMTDEDIAKLMLLVHWGYVSPVFLAFLPYQTLEERTFHEDQNGITKLTFLHRGNTNTFKLCFWVLAHLLHDAKLLDTIRAETAQTICNDKVNLDQLMNCCPRLEALFFEVMRLTASLTTMRKILSPTEIGGKILPQGYRVLVPYRQLHFNEDAFGENVDEFDPERFLVNKNLTHNPAFRPFGGGANLCPGRFIARQEVVVFIALILHRFDIERVERSDLTQKGTPTHRLPNLSMSRPCLGIMGPADGEDVIIDVKQRAHFKTT